MLQLIHMPYASSLVALIYGEYLLFNPSPKPMGGILDCCNIPVPRVSDAGGPLFPCVPRCLSPEEASFLLLDHMKISLSRCSGLDLIEDREVTARGARYSSVAQCMWLVLIVRKHHRRSVMGSYFLLVRLAISYDALSPRKETKKHRRKEMLETDHDFDDFVRFWPQGSLQVACSERQISIYWSMASLSKHTELLRAVPVRDLSLAPWVPSLAGGTEYQVLTLAPSKAGRKTSILGHSHHFLEFDELRFTLLPTIW
ncbi:uncharacterized protein CLUP02_12199 [Colletotrichum lupini]|uniref:Uncharacterized protein n=1 Tax=Colletotrichum lupini TaxID=145971 RepID=A0A9Q8T047_9PEZI|nr:uncharacterized protein CLUP02_12199 [Colletotrichum lupini]KAK1710243.1 hypothetical protein BDP67DRAFT_110921 [Colletotrichum lupini]UQC86697.1 hypothetical protein CLUP02_12199 [Colletotrichum lupini]